MQGSSHNFEQMGNLEGGPCAFLAGAAYTRLAIHAEPYPDHGQMRLSFASEWFLEFLCITNPAFLLDHPHIYLGYGVETSLPCLCYPVSLPIDA